MDESSSLYPEYKDYVLSGNPVDFTENLTDLEVEYKLNCFRQECSESISNIQGLQESIERKIINNTDIPLEILNKRESIKEDYRIKKEEYIASLTTITIINTTV
jgi:hypothetical protein